MQSVICFPVFLEMIVFYSYHMRGIGSMSLVSGANLDLPVILNGMKRTQNYRGYDGQVQWLDEKQRLRLCHNRLASRLKWLTHWC